MKVKFVNLVRQNKLLKNELFPAIAKIIKNAEFILGESLENFENDFARFCKKRYAVGLNSGTDALKLSLIAYGIGKGDEVITTPNSYFSTACVITEIGATPVFVDALADSYTIDAAQIEAAITKKTKAIIPVHLYGQAADMDPILSIARKNNLVVIEDACQAHGAMYKGKVVPVSETGVFSFYPGKNLGCFGDGGAVVTDNSAVKEKLLYLRNDGAAEKYYHTMFGVKSRLDTLQAAILQVKLPHLTAWNSKRREHAKMYTSRLQNIPNLKTPYEDSNMRHVYHLYVIEYQNRDALRKYLKTKGIETGIHYPIPIHLQPPYRKQGFKEGDFPVSEKNAYSILSLPMFPELTNREIVYVTESIKQFITKQ